MTITHTKRAWSAVIAAILGIVLLSSNAGTLAAWYEEARIAGAEFHSGHLRLQAQAPKVTLLSKIPAERRNVSGGTACEAPAEYRMCRSFTGSQLDDVKLVPGDRVDISATVTASATGDNLVAEVMLDQQPVHTGLPAGTTVESSFTRNGEPVTPPATIRGTDSEEDKAALWNVTVTVTTPNQWPASFQQQNYTLSSFDISVNQVG